MKNTLQLLVFTFLLLQIDCSAQGTFSGKLVYKGTLMNVAEGTKDSSEYITIFCEDSLTRTETFNEQIGRQVYIEHLGMHKGYLLLYYQGKKFAIQQHDTSTTATEYTFKKKFGKKKVMGIKCKKVMVSHPKFTAPMLMYYAPKINSKYNKAVKGIGGLPTDYYLSRSEGLMHYELVEFSITPIDHNLFGIPSDFKRITFDQFLEQMDVK